MNSGNLIKEIYLKTTPILLIFGFLFILINIDWVIVTPVGNYEKEYDVNCNELRTQNSVNFPTAVLYNNLNIFNFELGDFRFSKQFGSPSYSYTNYGDNMHCLVHIEQRYFEFDDLKFLLLLYIIFSISWLCLIRLNLIKLSFILLVLSFPIALTLDLLIFGINLNLGIG